MPARRRCSPRLGLLDEIAPGRRIAVLGDMRELGEESETQHRMVGRRAAEVVDELITFGPLARLIADEACALSRERIPGFTCTIIRAR